MRPLLPRAECLVRLRLVFPRSAFDPVHANPLAAAALAAMLYVDAVVPDEGDAGEDATWARPSLCLWMNDATYARDAIEDRIAWYNAALRPKARESVEALLNSWCVPVEPLYRDNSRETLRDETFPAWLGHGAMRDRPGIATTSGRPRWALTASFADLFLPDLRDDDLVRAIDFWRETHLTPGDRLRISTVRERELQWHAVQVRLPNGQHRQLEPGDASLILKGVIEQWVPRRLKDPVVLSISEPGDKVYVADAAKLRTLGISLDSSTLLPDALIVDIASRPPTFWIVEAVATDGPVTEDRKRQLARWAEDQRIPVNSCRFLSAFISRNAVAARRRLKDLAANTFAWYSDEPHHELAWYEIAE